MKVGSLVRPCEKLDSAAGWFGVVVEMREALSREGFPGVWAKVSFLGDPCRQHFYDVEDLEVVSI
jgi:hypothetical protein